MVLEVFNDPYEKVVDVSAAAGWILTLALALALAGNIFSIPGGRLEEGLGCRRGIIIAFQDYEFSLALSDVSAVLNRFHSGLHEPTALLQRGVPGPIVLKTVSQF